MQWIDRCLGALHTANLLQTTVVVDNASTDQTVAHIRDNYPQVHLIEPGRNLGFGAGNNLGINYALSQGADAVFLLNQDAWPLADAVTQLINAAAEDSTIGIVSPVHLQADEQTLDQLFASYLAQSHTTLGISSTPVEVDFVNAAAWLLPRQTLERVGGFSPLFYHYGEDRDYAARLAYHGLRTVVVPTAHCVHDRGDRPLGWREAPQRQLVAMQTGFEFRAANPGASGPAGFASALKWLSQNIAGALRAGYWQVLPKGAQLLARAIRTNSYRRRIRQQVRQPGRHFLAP